VAQNDLLEFRACLSVAVDLGLELLSTKTSYLISSQNESNKSLSESWTDEVEEVGVPGAAGSKSDPNPLASQTVEPDLLDIVIRLARLRILTYLGDKDHSLGTYISPLSIL
jgi:hypothetical protein